MAWKPKVKQENRYVLGMDTVVAYKNLKNGPASSVTLIEQEKLLLYALF